MPRVENTEKTARKILPIIYVLDASGSMQGDRIAAVNSAMNETVEVLKAISNENPSAELKIGVLEFSSGANWITDDLVFLEDYFWQDIQAGGLTDFGSAIKELDSKLSRKAFLKDTNGYKAPVIIFMSDGEPTDDYKSAVEKISSTNNWYKVSTKIALAIGDDANQSILSEIVGNSEATIPVTDLESLKKLIKVVSVTASQIGSQSRIVGDTAEEIMRNLGNNTVEMDAFNKDVFEHSSTEVVDDPFQNGNDSDDPWENFSFE